MCLCAKAKYWMSNGGGVGGIAGLGADADKCIVLHSTLVYVYLYVYVHLSYVCATLVYVCARLSCTSVLYPLLLLQTTQILYSEVHAVRAA